MQFGILKVVVSFGLLTDIICYCDTFDDDVLWTRGAFVMCKNN